MNERPSNHRSLVQRSVWLFLAGPAIWCFYFWIVHLAAEAGCVANTGAVAIWIAIGMTGATSVAIAYHTSQASKDSDNPGGNAALLRAGYRMGGLLVVASLVVGVPALMLGPC